MFSSLSARMNVAFFQLMIYAATHVETAAHLQAFALILPKVLGIVGIAAGATPPTPTDCGVDVVAVMLKGFAAIIKVLVGLGIGLSVIGIIAGGLMRATSFGNERRIAMSNTAITCAVVGLVIVLLGTGVGNELPTWFGFPGGGTAS